MTIRIANHARIASFAIVALGLVLIVEGLALRAAPLGDVTNYQDIDQDIDPMTMGRNACCLMLPDDWIYWDR